MSKETKVSSLADALCRYQSGLLIVGTVSRVLDPIAKLMGVEEEKKQEDLKFKRKYDKWLIEQASRFPEELKI